MDKWQQRAYEKKKAREKQLRRRLTIAGGVAVALVASVIFAVIPHEPSVSNTSGQVAAGAATTEQAGAVYYADGTGGSASENGAAAADVSDTASNDTSVAVATDSAAQPAAATATPVPTATPAPTATPEPTATPVPTETPAPAVPDRSDFAVDPNNQNWNYDQTAEKTVYLTFDDGPSYLTPQVLDILDSYGIKATFFVTAQNPDYFGLIKEAYDRGNTIALHSYTHEYDQIYASVDAFFEDLDQIAAVVQEQIGYVPCFIRFPGGASNGVSRHYCEGIMTALSQEVQARGYQYWDWNAATGDGESVTTEESIANALSAESQTIVLLCHDGELKETTVEALPAIIEGFQERGYVFKPIDRTSTVVHHEIFN